jgi:hypothetical protein
MRALNQYPSISRANRLFSSLFSRSRSASHRMVWGDPDGVTDDPHSLFAIASGACG